jgi:hypothetical protein
MKAVSITEANTDLHRLTVRGGRCVIAQAIGGLPANPAPLQHAQGRRQSWDNRVTDQITR